MRKIGMLAVVLLAVAGCTQSKVPSDAAVTLSGKITRQDGAPAANLRMALTRVPDLGEVAFQGIPIAASLGTACLVDNPPPLCKLLQRVNTDSAGSYTVHMTGADVQGTFGDATNFDLEAQLPSGTDGPSVRASFEIQRTDLTVPTLAFWEPGHVWVHGDAAKTTVNWDKLDGADDYTVHFSVNGHEIWAGDAQEGGTLDARVGEDAHGVFHVSTANDVTGPDTTFHITHVSQGVGFTGTAGAPESRSKRCYAQGTSGPVELNPCKLTNGAFDTPLAEPACPVPTDGTTAPACTPNTWVYVDLGAPTKVGTVLARSVPESTLVVETSDDAQQWTQRATGTASGQPFVEIVLPSQVTARYVRLRCASADKLTGVTQLSVWP